MTDLNRLTAKMNKYVILVENSDSSIMPILDDYGNMVIFGSKEEIQEFFKGHILESSKRLIINLDSFVNNF